MTGDRPWPQAPVGNKDHNEPAVVIIGAGVSGICMAIDLIRRNNCRNVVIVERSGGLGGTWRDNKYPGCCCDVFSILYSYSFEQNPDWSRLYPGQEEILEYLVKVAEKYSLYKHMRFNTTVKAARWNDSIKKWQVDVKVENSKESEFSDAYTLTTDCLLSAVGQLNVPRMPKIPGIDEYRGKTMHSARWDWSYDLRGKKIGIIGNGATAVQIVPEIVKVASHVTVYQRTPNWVIPRWDMPATTAQKLLFRYFPPAMHRARAASMDFREWSFEGITNGDSWIAEEFRKYHREALRKDLPDKPDMWEKLTPEYNPGCKRIIISDDYFPTLGRPNCTLETRPIDRIAEKGVFVQNPSGEDELQEFDLIVFATGFRTVEFMHPIEITGRNNRSFAEIWKGGAHAYQGVVVEDAPNFGIFYGPNTNLGHNSIILMIEAQSRYLNEMVGKILQARTQGKTLAVYPTTEVVEAWNEKAQERLKGTSFSDPKCNSWYKNAEGRITNNWYGTVMEYQKDLSIFDWNDYTVEGDAANMVAGKVTKLGRVREETVVSNKALLAASALSLVSAMAVVGGLMTGRLDLRRYLRVR